jgi:mannose-6-phosphate isomerase-like protein (cupin superfamily)
MAMAQKCVYSTQTLKGYRFLTHRNDLIVDRQESEALEAIFTVLEPGQQSFLHLHRDCEQLWYILEGGGRLFIGEDREHPEEHLVGKGDVVLTRRNIYHSIENPGEGVLRYLAVDVFVGERNPDEPTWDAHVAALCRQNDCELTIEEVHYEP